MPQRWHYFYKIANYFSCSPLGRPFPTLAAGLSSSLRAEVGSFLGRPSRNSPCSTTSSQVGPFPPFFKICRGLILVSWAVSELRKKLNQLLVDVGYERLVSRFLCFVDSVFFQVRPGTRLFFCSRTCSWPRSRRWNQLTSCCLRVLLLRTSLNS